ncbi:PREDICTED: uncharacterized protein LOC109162758 [Ipomoea nil]|uniref:uncharacterized protein LOC109162758 n=1 Tax=Ipomoea nil TaxID=35883 RepID=UPI0009012849|nr:PREDICTED: uncharacterized protein LOC109162758 [Ipomoea nil]
MSSPSQSHWDVLTMAAKENDVTALYKSIQDDPEILKKIKEIPFVDTPLHVAAANGNTLFAVEAMAIMPSFCKKLNGEGLSPLHLALQNSHLKTAGHMVKLDGGLVRVGGRGKMTPMHYLVSVTKDGDAEKLELLIDFLTACPGAVKDVTVDCKTPMHVAIERRSFDAFGVMFGWVWRTGKIKVLDMEDVNGNTALRLAAEAQHTMNAETSESGVERPKRIPKAFKKIRENSKEIIANAKGKEGINRLKFFLSSETPMQKLIRYSAHIHKGMSMNIRNVVLVVAVLVATAVYQATLTPPNGVLHNTTTDPTSPSPSPTPNNTVHHHYKRHFTLFVSMNTLAFNLALGVMLFVLPFVLYSVFLHLALYFMSVSFLIMLHVTGEKENKTTAKVLMYISLGLFGIAYCVRFFIATLKTILRMPWWVGKPCRMMRKLIGCMGMQNSFHELQLQLETLGWSGDPHGSYYSQ